MNNYKDILKRYIHFIQSDSLKRRITGSHFTILMLDPAGVGLSFVGKKATSVFPMRGSPYRFSFVCCLEDGNN